MTHVDAQATATLPDTPLTGRLSRAGHGPVRVSAQGDDPSDSLPVRSTFSVPFGLFGGSASAGVCPRFDAPPGKDRHPPFTRVQQPGGRSLFRTSRPQQQEQTKGGVGKRGQEGKGARHRPHDRWRRLGRGGVRETMPAICATRPGQAGRDPKRHSRLPFPAARLGRGEVTRLRRRAQTGVRQNPSSVAIRACRSDQADPTAYHTVSG